MSNLTITEDQALRIRRALSRTSFGGGLLPENLNGETLVAYLEENADNMREIGTKHDAMETELSQIKADLRAAGRLFALTQPPSA